MNNAPIFIVGCDRSGTTLLRLILNQHSRIAIPIESDFLLDFLEHRPAHRNIKDERELKKLFNDIITTRWFQSWHLDEVALWRRMVSADRHVSHLLRTPFEMYAEREGKMRWGDKTPRHVTWMPELHSLFQDAQFVHIVRDGRDVAVSLKNVPWFHGNIVTAADFWKERVKIGRRDGKMLGENYLEVTYEDLVNSPEEILRKICIYIGEEFEPTMLEYYKETDRYMPKEVMSWHQLTTRQVTSGRTRRWRSQLKLRELGLFELVAGETLEEFGYTRATSASRNFSSTITLFAMRAPISMRRKLGHLVRKVVSWSK